MSMDVRSDMDRVLLHYLRQRGFSTAYQALEADLRARHGYVDQSAIQQLPVSQGLSADRALGEQLVFWGLLEGKASRIVESYEKLQDFLDNSIELYRTELSTVAFPVFAHVYLGLVAMGHAEEAQHIMESYGTKHDDRYLDEVNSLRQVATPDQLENSAYVAQLRDNRFHLELSSTSFKLLNGFLVNAGLVAILSILNNRVKMRVTDRPPLQQFHVSYCGAEETVPARLVPQNTGQVVRWGAYPSPEVAAAVAAAQEGRAPYDAASAAAADANAKLGKPVSPEALAAAAPAKAPPLPAMSEFDRFIMDRLVLRPLDGSKLLAGAGPPITTDGPPSSQPGASSAADTPFIGDPLEPSAVMATFTALPQRLTCAAPAPDLGLLAAGFEDRVVRVWRTGAARSGEDSGGQGRHWGRMAPTSRKTPENTDGAGVSGSVGDTMVVQVEDGDSDEDTGGYGGGNGGSSSGPVRLVGHDKPVYSLSWSPEKRLLLSASGDGTIRLWDLKEPEPQQALVCYRAHGCPVWSVAFSPVGYYFASGAYDRTARMWSTDCTEPLRVMVGHNGDVTATQFHPNCNYLLTGSRDKTARLWDVKTGSCVRVLDGHRAAMGCVAVSPTGRYAAAGGDDGDVRVWELDTGKQLCVMRGHRGPVESVAFSAEGSALASGGRDETVRIWDIATAAAAAADSDGRGSGRVGGGGSGVWDVAAAAAGNRSRGGGASAREERVAEARHVFRTKQTPVFDVRWSPRNLLMVTGVMRGDGNGAAP